MMRLNQSTPVERKINVAARRRELQNVPFAETGLAMPSVMLALQAEDMFLFFDAAPDLIGAADGPPLDDTPEVVEADRVTGEDCFLAKLVVSDARELLAVVDRFQPYASADTAIILSSTVARRLPKL